MAQYEKQVSHTDHNSQVLRVPAEPWRRKRAGGAWGAQDPQVVAAKAAREDARVALLRHLHREDGGFHETVWLIMIDPHRAVPELPPLEGALMLATLPMALALAPEVGACLRPEDGILVSYTSDAG
jgi:hypothetical protein